MEADAEEKDRLNLVAQGAQLVQIIQYDALLTITHQLRIPSPIRSEASSVSYSNSASWLAIVPYVTLFNRLFRSNSLSLSHRLSVEC